MSTKNIQVAVSINRGPEDVIGFVSDVRNRPKYIQSLKSISDIQGEPGEISNSWHWT